MAACAAITLQFSVLFRKNILADFDGGRHTSDAGAFLLREATRRIARRRAIGSGA